jgi:hypothetical protein
MGLESARIDAFLVNLLSGSTALQNAGTPKLNTNTLGSMVIRLYDTEPPQASGTVGVAYPVLVFQLYSILSDYSFADRMGVSAVYLIKVIGQAGADWVGMAAILSIVDDLMTGVIAHNGWLFTIVPSDEDMVKIVDPDPGGSRRRHLGRFYRIAAEPAA